MNKIMNKLLTKIKEIQNAENAALPDALRELQTKRFLLGVFMIIFFVVSAIVLRNPCMLLGVIMALFLMAISYKVKYDYISGKIEEHKFTCIFADMNAIRNNISVTFKDEDNHTYNFTYPCRKQEFHEGIMYMVYINKNNARNILTYKVI